MGTSSPALPARGRRTLSFVAGGNGGHLNPGQQVGFDGVGRKRMVANIVMSRSGRYQGMNCANSLEVDGVC